ncbi:MAG: hypothetical protein Kow0027_10200 [Saprospiraceae bacterium]
MAQMVRKSFIPGVLVCAFLYPCNFAAAKVAFLERDERDGRDERDERDERNERDERDERDERNGIILYNPL